MTRPDPANPHDERDRDHDAGTAASSLRVHAPQRPTWDCGACGDPWPCSVARQRMLQEADTSLRIAAWANFEMAAGDMPDAPVAKLLAQFVGWIRTER